MNEIADLLVSILKDSSAEIECQRDCLYWGSVDQFGRELSSPFYVVEKYDPVRKKNDVLYKGTDLLAALKLLVPKEN